MHLQCRITKEKEVEEVKEGQLMAPTEITAELHAQEVVAWWWQHLVGPRYSLSAHVIRHTSVGAEGLEPPTIAL